MQNNLKDRTKKFFQKTKFVVSPSFPKEKIYFNSKGINHLFYKGARSGRTQKEITARVRLLPRAVTLLTKMPLPQEEDFYIKDEVRYNFWAFEGVINDRKIKVIIRQKGHGFKHFWSVIPSWRKNRFGVQNSKKKLSKI